MPTFTIPKADTVRVVPNPSPVEKLTEEEREAVFKAVCPTGDISDNVWVESDIAEGRMVGRFSFERSAFIEAALRDLGYAVLYKQDYQMDGKNTIAVTLKS